MTNRAATTCYKPEINMYYTSYDKQVNDDGSATAFLPDTGMVLFHVRDEQDFDDIANQMQEAFDIGVNHGDSEARDDIKRKLGL